jgi:L-lactate dehydrogenase complex protein LldF
MIEHLSSENFAHNARVAIADPILHRALKNLAENFVDRRRIAIASVDDWEGLREKARSIKEKTLLALDKYLLEFVTNAERAGSTVHWARDAAEACQLVVGLVKNQHAEMVVKSKSMATEEIHLNNALEAAGIEPIETDLGEWIIQLAGETPSHIVVPAIHKTKQQIAELFVNKVGIARTDDVNELTRTARRILREKFASARVGISGVNFGVAETGTILILENEGNVRMTTSLPRVHIALMGIEKIIPRFEDLDVFLKLLPRSGTGQKLTAYQSLITGRKRSSEAEGPDEVHIILLDGGRSRMLGHPVTRQSLACIRCGACLNACPVYQQVGGHAYGSVYPGPIGAVITPQLFGLKGSSQLPYASSLCGACREVCPVKIDIPKLLLHLRSEIVQGVTSPDPPKRKIGERLAFKAFAYLWATPRRYSLSVRLTRIFQKAIVRNGTIGRVGRVVGSVVPPLAAWTALRDAPSVAPKTFREEWRERGQRR